MTQPLDHFLFPPVERGIRIIRWVFGCRHSTASKTIAALAAIMAVLFYALSTERNLFLLLIWGYLLIQYQFDSYLEDAEQRAEQLQMPIRNISKDSYALTGIRISFSALYLCFIGIYIVLSMSNSSNILCAICFSLLVIHNYVRDSDIYPSSGSLKSWLKDRVARPIVASERYEP